MTKLRMGLVIDKDFHEENRWCCATTFYLVEAFKERFECFYIQGQSDYEDNLGDVDLLISMEPSWAAPVLELSRTSALREKLSSIPSYIFYSDPHSNKWRQDYFLKNGLGHILTFYYAPIRYHFTKVPPDKLVHFPWTIPDHWVDDLPLQFRGQSKICCFGACKSEAYIVRNWCRSFAFVESTTNSGVENKVMTDAEYIGWLRQKDAAIAAGSDSVKYRLTVPKYFEIAAGGALLFAQETEDLGLLGFKHGENCIIFNRSNFEKLAKEYLANPTDYLKIRQAGRELIRRRHILSRRMDFLDKHISLALRQKTDNEKSSQNLHLPCGKPDNKSLTDKEYWDSNRKKHFVPWEVEGTKFSKILDRHLPINPDFTCVEIGAYPGTNLCYFAKKFKYYPVAIEFSDYCAHIEQLLTFNNIQDYKIIRQELFEPLDMKFDVVSSFGFVEHFEDYERVIDRHFQLLKPGGYVVISTPYLDNFQGLLRKTVYTESKLKEIMSSHNLDIMNINELKRVVSKYEVEILFSDFILGNDIWFNWKDDFVRPNMRWLVKYFNALNQSVGNRIPSSELYSPMIMLIAKDKTKAGIRQQEEFGDNTAADAPEASTSLASVEPGATSSVPSRSPQATVSAVQATAVTDNLERSQWSSLEELKQVQWERLKRLLEHSYEHVPFYRSRFEAVGLGPDDIRTMDDLRKIPILKKTDIQQNLEAMKATNYPADELIRDVTGGSTGNPLVFFRDSAAELLIAEAAERFRRWIGYRPADKLALIWGADRDIPSSYPANRRWLNTFNCSAEQIEAFIKELVGWRPKAIRGYGSSLYLIASYIKSQGLQAPRPEVIESAAEKLWPEQRALIEEVFQCKVFEVYGSREVPSLACECGAHRGLHVFSDIRLVEVIKDGLPAKPGEDGSIIITDLVNYGMPFIRYEIGDVGVRLQEACSCGRALPLLKEVKGRITSTIQTPDGRYIHGEYFTHLFYNIKGVKTFQVWQKSLYKIEVLIQKDEGFDSSLIEALVGQMRVQLGPEVSVEWASVDEIPPAPSGKRHFTISDVPIDFTAASGQDSLEHPTSSATNHRDIDTHCMAEGNEQMSDKAIGFESAAKPQILFIVDAPNWAHDFKAGNLMRVLGDSYTMQKRYTSDVTADDIEQSDLVVIFYWKEFYDPNMKKLIEVFQRNQHKLLLGICSHCELAGRWRDDGLTVLRGLGRVIFVTSRLLYKEFAPMFDVPVFYTPNGVDTAFFAPGGDKKVFDKLRVGWAGSLTNNGDMRGYHEFIVPAVSRVEGAELITAAREERWRSHKEMQGFYRSLDLYICASSTEGTPNPCLEAAACGVPLLTTRVGNMPELVEDGVNGFFIERNLEDIVEKLILLRDDRVLRERLGQSMLRSIQKWDWRRQAENYRTMIETVLQDEDASRKINQRLRPRVVNRQGDETIVELEGLRLFLKPQAYIDRELIEGRLWEEKTTHLLSQIIKLGMTVLDVGANFGYYTLLFSKWVGRSGRVIAFEPTEVYGRRLVHHITENSLQNVRFEAKGLSDQTGTARINIGECSGTMHWINSCSPRGYETVEMITLDQWWRQYIGQGNTDKLDFIKLDVDGHEPRFLRGAREVLLRQRPVILLEFFKPQYAKAGYSCEEVVKFLENELGYILCSGDDGRPFHSRRTLFQKVNHDRWGCNILCIPAEKLEDSRKHQALSPKNENTEQLPGSCKRTTKAEPVPAKSVGLRCSVVVTTCNRPVLLRRCLAGFAEQTMPKEEFEVIVVDDGSDPPARKIVESYAERINVTYLYQENSGLAAARNAGIKVASDEIILFSDDDDLADAALVAEHLKKHQEHPDERTVVLGHLQWHPELRITPLMHYVTEEGGEYFGYVNMQDGGVYNGWKWWGGLVSVKRSLLRSVEGPFDERLQFGYEDSELVCRLGPDSIQVVYNSRAKSYVLRPVKFESFCRRRYMQGRALYRVARKHPEFIMPRYGLYGIAEVYQRGVGPYLDEWHDSFRETAALLDEQGRWSAEQDESFKQVYSFYCGCFMGYWLKGYLDEKQAIESGGKSISEPVNCDSGNIVIESDAAEVSTAGEDVKIEAADSGDTTGAVEHLGENLVADKPAANEGLKIAFISGTLPRFDIGSSDNRIHHIVKILAREGHKVDYLYYLETPKDEFYKQPYGTDMNFVRLGTAVQDFISYFEKRQDVDFVWITNIWTAEYARPFIELCEWIRANRPSIKIIIDTMDFHYKKFLRKYEVFKDPQVLARANEFLEVEKRLYPLADEVITVSEPDKNDIHENIRRELNVGVVPNIHQVSASVPGFDARKNLCFLGSFGVDHNADAVRSFLQNVWPSILQAEGAVEFHIFGFQSEKFRVEFERHRNVKVLGYVEDAEATVANYKALVCPLLYGSGMKGKIGLAASVGTPVVTTNIGAEGFGLIDGQNGFIADDAAGFVKKCLGVLSDGVTWRRLSENVRRRVAEKYSVEAVREKIRSILGLTARGDFAEGDGLSASAADAQAERERQANIYEVKSLLEQYCGGGSGPIAPVQSNLRT